MNVRWKPVGLCTAVTLAQISASVEISRAELIPPSRWNEPATAANPAAFHQPSIRGDATGAAVQLLVHAFNPQGKNLNALVVGDEVVFEVGVSVDPAYIPPGQIGGTGNNGLAYITYDVSSNEASANGYFLDPMNYAFSGFGTVGDSSPPAVGFGQTIASNFYNVAGNSVHPAYGGGWGFGSVGERAAGRRSLPAKS